MNIGDPDWKQSVAAMVQYIAEHIMLALEVLDTSMQIQHVSMNAAHVNILQELQLTYKFVPDFLRKIRAVVIEELVECAECAFPRYSTECDGLTERPCHSNLNEDEEATIERDSGMNALAFLKEMKRKPIFKKLNEREIPS